MRGAVRIKRIRIMIRIRKIRIRIKIITRIRVMMEIIRTIYEKGKHNDNKNNNDNYVLH